jgi:TerY-C metal binding domain
VFSGKGVIEWLASTGTDLRFQPVHAGEEVDPQERSLVCGRCGYAPVRDARFCTRCGAAIEPSSNGASAWHDIRTSREAILVAGARGTATRKAFEIRFEQSVSGIWQACDAFTISERQLCNPAFFGDQVTSASLSPSYPGCPHCGADRRKEFAGVSFVLCSCGKLACSTGIIGSETVCPWCGRIGNLAKHAPLPVFGIKDR